jgi:hypothetical protein
MADPEKRTHEWEQAQRKAYATPAIFDQEMGISFTAFYGALVFPEFRRECTVVAPQSLAWNEVVVWMSCDPHPRTPSAALWLAVTRWGDHQLVSLKPIFLFGNQRAVECFTSSSWRFTMRSIPILMLLACSAMPVWPQTDALTNLQIITFDAPGAGTASGQGTVARSLNPTGAVTGEYYDSSEAVHGFVRAADSAIITVDVPNASTANGQGTFPRCINPSGEIAGFYYEVSPQAVRGFVRDSDGNITTFDAGPVSTVPESINPSGEVTGTFEDFNFIPRGFVRDRGGNVTAFDAGPVGTFPLSINPRGEVTGYFIDPSALLVRGFVRDRDGNITAFNVGSAKTNSTFPISIDPRGVIAGFYADSGGMTHGFLRKKDGEVAVFDAGPFDTTAMSINPRGEITGYYFDANDLAQAFVRDAKGQIVTFDVPDAGGPFFGDGTLAQSINPSGEIAGSYTDAIGSYHGFLRIPNRGKDELIDQSAEAAERTE